MWNVDGNTGLPDYKPVSVPFVTEERQPFLLAGGSLLLPYMVLLRKPELQQFDKLVRRQVCIPKDCL